MKKHWKTGLILIIAAALAWGIWYARPVDIYTLAPEVQSPNGITVDVQDLGAAVGEEPRFCSRGFTPEDPEWAAVLSQIEALRFRRPPWNLVLQFVPQNTVTGRITHDGDRQILLYVGRRGARSIRIQFFIDEWDYLSPHSNRNLTLWVKDSRQTGDALAEVLRPLLGEP